MRTCKDFVSANREQSFALYEMQHALLDGVFESRRDIKKGYLHLREITGSFDWKHPETGKVYPKAIKLTLLVPTVLDTKAEDILLAIIRIAGIDGHRVHPDQPMLASFDPPERNAKAKDTIEIHCTKYELLKAADMGTGKHDYEQQAFYLKHMSRIIVEWENTASGWSGSCWFLSHDKHEDGRLIIRLNWRLAGAIFGSDGDYAKIDLNERRSLKKDPSKTLHRWLSAHLWSGRSEYILYETLIKHIWSQEATPSAQRKRLERLKNEILPELGTLPQWKIKTNTRGAQITHHKDKQGE